MQKTKAVSQRVFRICMLNLHLCHLAVVRPKTYNRDKVGVQSKILSQGSHKQTLTAHQGRGISLSASLCYSEGKAYIEDVNMAGCEERYFFDTRIPNSQCSENNSAQGKEHSHQVSEKSVHVGECKQVLCSEQLRRGQPLYLIFYHVQGLGHGLFFDLSLLWLNKQSLC